MDKEITIYFDAPKKFEASIIRPLNGLTGLYFIFSQSIDIQYPFAKSKLLYIGMSEKKTNSIGNRLLSHFEGKSKNIGLSNYRKIEPLYFTYVNFEILQHLWKYRVEDLESHFITDFVQNFGVYPICNNKTGLTVLDKKQSDNLKIDWDYFK